MIDERLYRETFSRLRASQKSKEEVLHMMRTRQYAGHLPKALRTAAIAAMMTMALAVTAGAVNLATDGEFFRQFTVTWVGEDTLLAQDQEGNQVYITADSEENGTRLVSKENDRLILHADRDIDITEQIEETGSYHYEYDAVAIWEDGSREVRTITIDVAGDLNDWTVTRSDGGRMTETTLTTGAPEE